MIRSAANTRFVRPDRFSKPRELPKSFQDDFQEDLARLTPTRRPRPRTTTTPPTESNTLRNFPSDGRFDTNDKGKPVNTLRN